MPTIDMKVRIRCQDHRSIEGFSHSYKGGIGKACWDVGIFLHEFQHRVQIPCKLEGQENSVPAKECTDGRRAARTQQVKCLGKYGFALSPRGRKAFCLGDCPAMVGITPAEQRYQESCVNEDVSGHNR